MIPRSLSLKIAMIRDEKVANKSTSWAIAHSKGNIDKLLKLHKTEGKFNGKLTKMVIYSGSEQTFVRTDHIERQK